MVTHKRVSDHTVRRITGKTTSQVLLRLSQHDMQGKSDFQSLGSTVASNGEDHRVFRFRCTTSHRAPPAFRRRPQAVAKLLRHRKDWGAGQRRKPQEGGTR